MNGELEAGTVWLVNDHPVRVQVSIHQSGNTVDIMVISAANEFERRYLLGQR